ncbi:MAG: hypothetical protein E7588_09090 [Ruminococcaceae bacterium]|nr:hypothetical protein [Oscillospiraceae bacterium]
MDNKFATIETLMRELGCEKWPQRWYDLYPEVIKEYSECGCKYADPAYYIALHEKYSVLNDVLEYYIKAAEKISQSEPLSIFLLLLATVLKNREKARGEMSFSYPKSADGKPDLAIDMLRGLAMATMIPYSHEKMKARGIPDDIVTEALRLPEHTVTKHIKNHGYPGFDLMAWFQLSIDCKLYRLGRLEIEIERKFDAGATVFRNSEGETVILAHEKQLHKTGYPLGMTGYEDEEGSWTPVVTETEDAWTGYPHSEMGYVRSTPVTLLKSQWKKVLEKGDYIVSLHIPAGGGMTPEAVDDSIARGIEFLAKYYPEYDYKAFHCHSWLMDPQLKYVLGEDTNIAKFLARFNSIAVWSDSKGIFYHVFGRDRNSVSDVSVLPETTSLFRALKNYYMSGGKIYEMQGIFFTDK